MKTTRLLVALISILLSACIVGGRPSSPLLSEPLAECPAAGEPVPAQGCITQCRDQKNDRCPVNKPLPNVVSEIPLNDTAAPQLGLALSGGGSKAAPFAIGVIKRFIDNKWIFKTQYLTSVSGGSYAAFYLYYRAYRAVMADEEINPQDQLNHQTQPRIMPPELPVQNDTRWPGISRYFVDARDQSDPAAPLLYLTFHSSDLSTNGRPTPYSLASNIEGCRTFTNIAANAPNGALPVIWEGQKQELYQGWVECYQDMLMTHPTQESTARLDDSQLAVDFEVMFLESLAALPPHYFANILFDWKQPISPTQYDYLHGIERTYAFLPMPGASLPIPLNDDIFTQLANCLTFKDLAQIYLADEDSISHAIGGILPKWILESTGTNGNVGLNFSPHHYDLSQDVFEISFDEYGSGRFGYVKGAPSVIGLTVPYAVLASSAFADTAQRSLSVPRGVVDLAIQGLDIKWGIDVANYNVSNARRLFHSFLIWPFYYIDDPMTPYTSWASHAPTIHLSDGGQSGDNLGLIAMFRRGVRNIVVAAGEDDFHSTRDDPDGWLDFGSLCAANYYLIQRGFTLEFEADPRHPGPAATEKKFNLKDYCTWDGNRQVYIHPDRTKDGHITPFNWARRVWIGTIVEYKKPLPFPVPDPQNYPELPQPPEAWTPQNEIPQGLAGIKIYYLNAALDRDSWVALSTDWNPQDTAILNFTPFPLYPFTVDGDTGQRTSPGAGWPTPEAWYPGVAPAMATMPQREWHCEGELATMRLSESAASSGSDSLRTALYSCPLLAYVWATNDAVLHDHIHWLFPQTSTWLTTYDNSVNLFRAYRDLGWEYAGALEDVPDKEWKDAMDQDDNALPTTFRNDFPYATTAYRDPEVCKGWVSPKTREEASSQTVSAPGAQK